MLKRFKSLRASGGSRLTRRGALFGRFSRDNDGVAAVEFALLLPLLMALMLGSIELTHSMWGMGKLADATNATANLIAMTPTLNDNTFLDLMAAAPLVLAPYPENDLSVVMTSAVGCFDDPDDPDTEISFYVVWSQGWQGDQLQNTGYAVDSEFPNAPAGLRVRDGETLIVSETSYTYNPRIARKVGTTVAMNDTAFHKPRDTERVSYIQAEGTPKTCADYRDENNNNTGGNDGGGGGTVT